jgi:hypothetical protein
MTDSNKGDNKIRSEEDRALSDLQTQSYTH